MVQTLKEFLDTRPCTTRWNLVRNVTIVHTEKSIGMEVHTMTYERPDVQILCTLHAFWDHDISKQLDEPVGMDWRARKIKECADSNAGRAPLRLRDICKQLALPMSVRQARRVFRNSMGRGFKEYVKKRRLAIATEPLQATNIPIKEIALEVGYRSTQNFAKRFKELFLVTPLEFRTLRQKKGSTAECVLTLPERRSQEALI
jgi:AraC-like DNA-binding protein